MPPRRLPEWIGATADSRLPDDVWKRVLDRHQWKCACCKRPQNLTGPLERDHIRPLIEWAGREDHGNRETNYQPLCKPCHGLKTKLDVARKTTTSRRKEMRPGFKGQEKRSSFKSAREGKYKYNWQKRRYEPVE